MTFLHISNGFGVVNGQQFYVCTDMPNYDIDDYFYQKSTKICGKPIQKFSIAIH